MTTREFIEMLKKEDPSGNLHVRVGDGIPIYAETKQGYWDGAYQYFDLDGKLVISVKGYKVDIHTVDYEDFIADNHGDYSNIRFEGFDTYCEQDSAIKRYTDKFEKISKDWKSFEQRLLEEFTFKVISKLNDGWKFRETKEKINWGPPGEFVKDDKVEKMCCGDFGVIRQTNFFESYDEDEKYRFWRLK
jgi:hypothetical protein